MLGGYSSLPLRLRLSRRGVGPAGYNATPSLILPYRSNLAPRSGGGYACDYACVTGGWHYTPQGPPLRRVMPTTTLGVSGGRGLPGEEGISEARDPGTRASGRLTQPPTTHIYSCAPLPLARHRQLPPAPASKRIMDEDSGPKQHEVASSTRRRGLRRRAAAGESKKGGMASVLKAADVKADN